MGRFPFAIGNSPVFTVRGGLAETEILPSPVLHWRSVMAVRRNDFSGGGFLRSMHAQVVRFHLAGRSAALEEIGPFSISWEDRLQIVPDYRDPDLAVTLAPSSPREEPRIPPPKLPMISERIPSRFSCAREMSETP